MILYLHGFRSSPDSFKARLLAARLAALGRADEWYCPMLPVSPFDAVALVEREVARRAAQRGSGALSGGHEGGVSRQFGRSGLPEPSPSVQAGGSGTAVAESANALAPVPMAGALADAAAGAMTGASVGISGNALANRACASALAGDASANVSVHGAFASAPTAGAVFANAPTDIAPAGAPTNGVLANALTRASTNVPTSGASAAAAPVNAAPMSEAPATLPVTVIGSSLGGYYATHLAEKHGWRAVLLNPAVVPQRDLSAYLGEQPLWHGGGSIVVEPRHLDELRALDVASVTRPGRYYLIAATGDEVLDYREMLARYPLARTRLIDGSDHGISEFADYVDDVIAFCDEPC